MQGFLAAAAVPPTAAGRLMVPVAAPPDIHVLMLDDICACAVFCACAAFCAAASPGAFFIALLPALGALGAVGGLKLTSTK